MKENIHQNATQENYLQNATATADALFEKFPACQWVANTFRFDGDADNIEYYAALNSRTEQSVSPVFKTNQVIERVGSGDCFMAGLIYGISSQHTSSDVISFAAAAAFGKLQEHGDATNNSVEQINNIMKKYQKKTTN